MMLFEMERLMMKYEVYKESSSRSSNKSRPASGKSGKSEHRAWK